MTAIPALSIPAKLYIACKKTLSAPGNALVLGSVALAAISSSSFRYGLSTFPLAVGSFAGSLWLSRSAMAQKIYSKLPGCPSALQRVSDRVHSFTTRTLPKSTVTPSILIPIGEELLFRGAIQTAAVAALGPIPGIALSALAFSGAHAERSQPNEFLNALAGGVVLGALKERVSLLASVGHHVGMNAFLTLFIGYQGTRGFVPNYLEAR